VTDGKIEALKRLARKHKCQQTTHDDYEDGEEDDMLAIARLVSSDMTTMEASTGTVRTGMMVT
jgi:hypothetical protein